MSYIRYLVGGLGFAFAMAVLVLGLEISATTAWSAGNSAPQDINRAMKGDRLESSGNLNAVSRRRKIILPIEPAAVLELLDGCEAMVSSIGQSPLARVAGRCLA